MELAGPGVVEPLMPMDKEKEGPMPEEQIYLTKTEARAGTTPHIVRYILAISLLLVVLAFAVVLGLFG